MTTEEELEHRKEFEENKCPHCGCAHLRMCARVREIRMSPSGAIIAVKFWKKWEQPGYVVMPEDVFGDNLPEQPDNGDAPITSTALEPYRP